jgi:predicted RNA binding protein YcfA (HicA-like mRNA interferase family)
MPPKIRQLKAALTKAGCYVRPGKGSHPVWQHAALPGLEVTLAGRDGDDAKPYQEKDVKNLLRPLKRREQ